MHSKRAKMRAHTHTHIPDTHRAIPIQFKVQEPAVITCNSWSWSSAVLLVLDRYTHVRADIVIDRHSACMYACMHACMHV